MKNMKVKGIFKYYIFISFPVVYSFLWFLWKQGKQERFSERHPWRLTITLLSHCECWLTGKVVKRGLQFIFLIQEDLKVWPFAGVITKAALSVVQPELNWQPPAWQPGAQTTEESKSLCQRWRLQAMSILSIRFKHTFQGTFTRRRRRRWNHISYWGNMCNRGVV